ncbi:MAG: glycosyltransferase family 39 protein [Eubacteriales bacterium]|nr:glycosyltransferase family 39 protein [Eubacteriales bacterium]
MTFCSRLTQHGKRWVCVFFILIVLLGLLTVMDYGRNWDELGEMRIFRMAIMEYGEALPFEAPFHQSLSEMGIIPLSESIEMDHNFSFYYPIAWAACNQQLTDRQFTMIWRGYTWLVFTLGLISLYAVCRRMKLNRLLCCIGVLLLLLSPRFFADGHYNNKDIALMAATGLVLWQSLRLAEKPCVSRALLFALAAGICVNTRIIGAAVCGLCGLMIVLRLVKERRCNRHAIGIGAIAVVGSILCYALLTPALLNDPIGYLNYVIRNSYNFTRWNGTLLFMGQEISLASSKPPFYYLPMTILITTPLLQLSLTLAGTLCLGAGLVRKRLPKEEAQWAALLATLLWLLPLLGCMVMKVRVYNGWRHLYFIYIPMVVTAVYGLNALWQRLRSRALPRRISAGLLSLLLLTQTMLLCFNHPYQYAYYNPLVARTTLSQRYELDYWNLSLYQAVKELLALEPNAAVIRVACTDERTRSGYAFATTFLQPEEDARLELVEDMADCYLIANTSYQLMAGYEIPQTMEPVLTIQSYGAVLCTVYHAKEDALP